MLRKELMKDSTYNIGKETLRIENRVASVVTTDQVINTNAKNIENRIYAGNTLTCIVTNKNVVKYHAREIESIIRYEKNKKIGTPKEVNLLKVIARTLIIDTPEDVTLFLSNFGRVFEEFIIPDWEKLSRCKKFSAVFFSKEAVLGVSENSPLFGLQNKLVVVNNSKNNLKINKVNKNNLERGIKRYCKSEKPKKRLCETTIGRFCNFVIEGNRVVLKPSLNENGYNKNIDYVAESNLSRAFGKLMEDGRIDFKNFAVFKGTITQTDVDIEVDRRLARENVSREQLSKETIKEIEDEAIKSLELLRTEIIMNGYYDEYLDEHFTYCATSGSQGRTGSCLFSTIAWEKTNGHCFGGFGLEAILDENGMAEPSVLDKRKSLKMSSSIALSDLSPKVFRKNDVDAIYNVNSEQAVEFFKKTGNFLIEKALAIKEYSKAHRDIFHKDGMIDKRKLPEQFQNILTGTPTDGQCSGSLSLFVKISIRYGRITEDEGFRLNKLYEKSNNLTDFYRSLKGGLKKAYENMIKFVTFRYGGAKGSIVLHDFDKREEYKNYDIIMPDSVCKFGVPMDEEGRFIGEEFAICLENKPLKGRAYLNYQAILAMEGLTGDILIDLAKKTIDNIEDALQDPMKAQILLSTSKIASDVEVEVNEKQEETELSEEEQEKAKKNTKYTSLVAKALQASGEALYDGYINRKAKDLFAKTIWDMAFGRIEVDGDYAFIVTDPNILIGDFNNCLQEGECYLSGKEQDVLLARAPLAYKSEIRKVKLVKNERLEYLNDVLVLNPYDGLLPAMSGADTDGDKVLVIYQKEIVDVVQVADTILIDCLKHKKVKVKIDKYTVCKNRARSMEMAQVGIFANLGAVARDVELSGYKYFKTKAGRQILLDDVCKDIRFLEAIAVDIQGQLTIPEHVRIPGKPLWLYAKKEMDRDSKSFIENKGDFTPKGEVIESSSPMAQLYNFIFNYMQEFGELDVEVAVNYANRFSKAINLENKQRLNPRATKDNEEYKKLVRMYMDIDTKDKDKEQIEKERNDNWEIIREYLDDCASAYRAAADTQEDMDTIVAALYEASYSDTKQGYGTFVWHVLGDELLDLMSRTLNSKDVIRMNVGEDVNEISVNALGMAFDRERYIGTFNLPEGNHGLIEYKGKKYIEVPRVIKTNEFASENNTSNKISLHCGDRSTKEVIDILREANFRVTVKMHNKNIYAFVDGEPLVRVCGFGLKEKLEAVNKVFDLKYADFGVMYRAYNNKYNRNDIEWTDDSKVFAYKKNITFFCNEVAVITDENGKEEENLIINEVEDHNDGVYNIEEIQIIENQEDLKDLFDDSVSNIDDEDDDLAFDFGDYAEEYSFEGDLEEDFNTDDFQ